MLVRVRIWVPFLLFVVPLHGADAKDLQKRLQKTLVNHVFMIRNFHGGDHLVFDAQGNLVGSAEPECWCAAQIQVQKLEIRDGNLILRGPRVVGTQKTHFFKSIRQQTQVQLDIALDRAQMNEEGINKVLERVF